MAKTTAGWLHPQPDPMLPAGTDRCRCTACGLYFGSSYGFDQHRTGPYPGRRCRTVEELRARGWSINASGHWTTSKRPARLTRHGLGAAIGSKGHVRAASLAWCVGAGATR
jgi:hypothetical protein